MTSALSGITHTVVWWLNFLLVAVVVGTPTGHTMTPTLTSTPTPEEQIQQVTEIMDWTIVVDYVHPDIDATTLYDDAHLRVIQNFEQQFMRAPLYGNFCIHDIGISNKCAPPQSVISVAYSDTHSTVGAALLTALQSPQWRPCVLAGFPRIQNRIRSFFRFGGPLRTYSSINDRPGDQQALFDGWFQNFFPYVQFLLNNSTNFSSVNISFRGGPFKIYEQEWAYYENQTGLSYSDPVEEQTRYSLFKDNLKRIEFLSSLKPGSSVVQMFNPYMHLTNKEFLALVYALPQDYSAPPYSTFLMWNIQPNLIDFEYPP